MEGACRGQYLSGCGGVASSVGQRDMAIMNSIKKGGPEGELYNFDCGTNVLLLLPVVVT